MNLDTEIANIREHIGRDPGFQDWLESRKDRLAHSWGRRNYLLHLIETDMAEAERRIKEDPSILKDKGILQETAVAFLAVENRLEPVKTLLALARELGIDKLFSSRSISDIRGLGHKQMLRLLSSYGYGLTQGCLQEENSQEFQNCSKTIQYSAHVIEGNAVGYAVIEFGLPSNRYPPSAVVMVNADEPVNIECPCDYSVYLNCIIAGVREANVEYGGTLCVSRIVIHKTVPDLALSQKAAYQIAKDLILSEQTQL